MKNFLLLFLLTTFYNFCIGQNFQNYYNVGNECQQKGQYQKAIDFYKKAEKKTSKAYERNRVYKALADSYKEISDYVHATDYYEKLLKIYNQENQKKILLNLSDLWILTGQYQKVIDNLKDMQNSPDETVRLTNLSAAYSKLGKPNEALILLDNVLKDKTSPNYKIALQNKGYILWQQKNYAEAEKLLEKAIILYNQDDPNKYICMGNLAKVKAGLKKYEQALETINEAIDWQENKFGNKHQDYINSIRKRAEIVFESGQTGDATELFFQYFFLQRNYITQNFAFMTEQERLNFWHSQKPLIEECYLIGNNDPEFLFDVAVFSKSILTSANRNFYMQMSNNKNLSEKYDSLIEMRAKTLITTGEERKKIEDNIRYIEKQLMESLPDFGNYINSLQIKGGHIRKTIGENDAAVEFIYYSKNDTMHYAAIVLQGGNTKFVPLFSEQEIETLEVGDGYATVRECINEPGNPFVQHKNVLYRDTLLGSKIWDEIVKDIPQNANVYFCPDGIFHQLAIEYLCFSRKDLNFFRLSSMRTLIEKKNQQDYNSILYIGSLNYNVSTSVGQAKNNEPDRSGCEMLRKNGIIVPYSFLSNSIYEIYNARNTFKAQKTKVLIRNQASEEVVKKELPQYKTVIISTHGYNHSDIEIKKDCNLADNIYADSIMSMCGIALSGVNVYSMDDSTNRHLNDGLLTALEMSRLDLSGVDFMIFSACQTNLGAVNRDGVFNIPRGLKQAGVNSMMVTLWQINDKSAEKIMTEFFKNLKQGKNKCEALKLAKDFVMKKNIDNFDTPYHLCPYIIIDGIN